MQCRKIEYPNLLRLFHSVPNEVVECDGSSKYAGKGHPLNFSISLIDRTNIVTNPRQKQKASEENYSSPYKQWDQVHHHEDEDALLLLLFFFVSPFLCHPF